MTAEQADQRPSLDSGAKWPLLRYRIRCESSSKIALHSFRKHWRLAEIRIEGNLQQNCDSKKRSSCTVLHLVISCEQHDLASMAQPLSRDAAFFRDISAVLCNRPSEMGLYDEITGKIELEIELRDLKQYDRSAIGEIVTLLSGGEQPLNLRIVNFFISTNTSIDFQMIDGSERLIFVLELLHRDVIEIDSKSRMYMRTPQYRCFFEAAVRRQYGTKPLSASILYSCGTKIPMISDEDFNTLNANLSSTTKLLPYQARTIKWMQMREIFGSVRSSSDSVWQRCLDADAREIFVCIHTGYISHSNPEINCSVSGGILAEEMGLGKTVETLGLISASLVHAHDSILSISKHKAAQNYPVVSAATLIICPNAILKQWILEINRHCPHLKFTIYTGMKARKRSSVAELVLNDLVITTFSVLRSEVHFAFTPPQRSLRSKYTRKAESPLVNIKWWRICVDEVQMVDSSISNVGRLSSMLPRVNSWAISGTPVKKDLASFFNVVQFLRIPPYVWNSSIWDNFIKVFPDSREFESVFAPMFCRNTKDVIGGELSIPLQSFIISELPFTAIEQQNYNDLVHQFLGELTHTGILKDGKWNGSDDLMAERELLATWLRKLRQTCCYSNVNAAHDEKTESIKSIPEIISSMQREAEMRLDTLERSRLNSVIERAWIRDHFKDHQEALKILLDTKKLTEARLEGKRYQESSSDLGELDSQSLLQDRLWLLILHKVQFYTASVYFQLGDSENENCYYDIAQTTRKNILKGCFDRAQAAITRLALSMESQTMRNNAKFSKHVLDGLISPPQQQGGLKVHDSLMQWQDLSELSMAQSELIKTIRAELRPLLSSPLVDEENKDPSGEEYRKSLVTQDVAFELQNAFQILLNMRLEMIDGMQPDKTLESKFRKLEYDEEDFQMFRALQTKLISLLERQKKLFLQDQNLKTISYRLRLIASGSYRREEQLLAQMGSEQLRKIISEQLEFTKLLQSEIDMYRQTYNEKIVYYRRLQDISDSLVGSPLANVKEDGAENHQTVPQKGSEINYKDARYGHEISELNGNNDKNQYDDARTKMFLEREQNLHCRECDLQEQIDACRARLRYLAFLERSQIDGSEQVCVICREKFEHGCITACGHIYCRECFALWYKQHKNCPQCKTKLTVGSVHSIILKKASKRQSSTGLAMNECGEWQQTTEDLRARIEAVPLRASFGSKIDNIIRHLLLLRRDDSRPKSVVFSQWPSLIDIVALSLRQNGLSYVRFDTQNLRTDPITKFLTDDSVEVFLLHGASQSSGLSLTNATNLFLCEPLLNRALLAQVASRIHRIGQTRETYVWLGIVAGSIEADILRISTRESFGQQQLQQKKQVLETNINRHDAKLSLGESVTSVELFDCLMTHINQYMHENVQV